MKICKYLKYWRLSIIIIVLSSSGLQAQVTIGSNAPPEKAALLDIKSIGASAEGGATTDKNGGGLLFSRVVLTDMNSLKPFFTTDEEDYDNQKKKHIGLVVYNVQDETNESFEEGLYVWNGIQWTKIIGKARDVFFYMPSVPISTSQLGLIDDPVELFDIYQQQFLSPKGKSTNAPPSIPAYEEATDLYYYVTSYDEDVFEDIEITEEGSMTYSVKKAADPWSFINIVFVVK